MSDPRKAIGARGEAVVAEHFEGLGFEIVDRNWTCPGGELDLVARLGELVVFIEVRTVTTEYLDSPTLTVNKGKQSRVARAADVYLRAHAIEDVDVRFDVVGVIADPSGDRLHHAENAFVPSWAF